MTEAGLVWSRPSIMRVFVVGHDGQVARSIREAAAACHDVVLECGRRPDVDLLRRGSLEIAVDRFRPDIIVNPAAYTAVDRAEAEPDLAFAINRDGAADVAAMAARLNVPLIHLSTDYVFAGDKKGPYTEDDPVGPQTVYGQSKLAGERVVLSNAPRAIILRTAWVYAPFGGNFVRTMIRLSKERDRLRVVSDQIGCPTYAPDIAQSILKMARQVVGSGWRDAYRGVTHLSGPDAVSWFDFAERIMQARARLGQRHVPVEAIMTSDYPTPAKRPANSVLSSARLSAVFGVTLPRLDQSLMDCLNRLAVDE